MRTCGRNSDVEDVGGRRQVVVVDGAIEVQQEVVFSLKKLVTSLFRQKFLVIWKKWLRVVLSKNSICSVENLNLELVRSKLLISK